MRADRTPTRCVAIGVLFARGLADHPGKECPDLREERSQDARQSLFERAHALRLEQRAVHVAEHVSESEVVCEFSARAGSIAAGRSPGISRLMSVKRRVGTNAEPMPMTRLAPCCRRK